ncbi:MAG: NAD(P)-binding protein [Rhodobacteraceae bacterium]|nr:NAD(P)-binding protein [Paracoccaceae bacterium]
MTAGKFGVLFEPVRIGPVTAPNRFFAVPHATGHGWNQPNGAIALRAMKAEGGWGTVAVQITEISPDSDMGNHPMERIWDESDIPRHRAQVDAIKRHGSLAAIEIAHGGMRSRNMITGLTVPGPSNLPVMRPEVPRQARAMDLADIRAFRRNHRAAAQRALTAGYDIIYVYAAHGLSILSHFLSASANRRTDEYGGSLTNRVRLLKEVLEDTLDAVSGKSAVALRFSVAKPGSLSALANDSEGRDVVEALAELPDLWDVNISGWPNDSATARFAEEGFQLPFTDFVKSVTSRPVVGVGRFTSPDLMVSLIRNGRLDLIGGARPSIADPFLPAKIRQGRVDDIRECIGCNICVSMDAYGLPVRCTQNPTISEEWRRNWHPETLPAARKRRSHLIVGAGPAGLECARALLAAGDTVTIADSARAPGGRVALECRLPGLASWKRVMDYRLGPIMRSAQCGLYLDSTMDARDIAAFDCDTVVLAAGSKWRADGVGSTSFDAIDFGDVPVFTPDGIMSACGRKLPHRATVVYDDDHFYMASAIAEHLCARGQPVMYVTPLPAVATWTEYTLEQSRIIERFGELGISIRVNTSLRNGPVLVDGFTGETMEIGQRNFVFVGARLPVEVKGVDQAISGSGRLRLVGDCLVPGTIQSAIYSGYGVARDILYGDNGKEQKRDRVVVETSAN